MPKKKGSTISLMHRIKIIDKKGKVKYDSGEKKSDSFVKNFMACLMNILSDSHILTSIWTDHDGVARSGVSKTSWVNSNYPFSGAAAATNDDYGIRVGTGTTPVTATDITIETLIVHGIGAGQLSYGAQVWVDVVESGSNVDFSWTRAFTNTSGGTITVTEIGFSVLAGTYDVMIARDVLDAPVAVADDEAIVVEYIWRTAVTA